MSSNLRVYTHESPRLRNPVMVCGLPDSGNVAKLIIDQLVKHLPAEKFAEIYSGSLPPKVLLNEDGTVEVPKHSMYFWKNSNSGRDLILYTGDAQPTNPEAAYALADKALEIGQSLGADTVYTVGAYITGEFVKEPKVYLTGTDKELLKELEGPGVSLISEGSITWMNGLLVGLSKLRNLRAVFVSGETSGYIVDAGAARAVLRVLSRQLGIELDLSELDRKARESEKMVEEIGGTQKRAGKDETGYIG